MTVKEILATFADDNQGDSYYCVQRGRKGSKLSEDYIQRLIAEYEPYGDAERQINKLIREARIESLELVQGFNNNSEVDKLEIATHLDIMIRNLKVKEE